MAKVGTMLWLADTLQEAVYRGRLDKTVHAVGLAWAWSAAAESPALSFSALTRSEIEARIGCSGVATLLQIHATRLDGSGHLVSIERDERFGTLFISHGVITTTADGETVMSFTRGVTSAVRHRVGGEHACPG